MRIFLVEILMIFFSVSNVLAEDSFLDTPSTPPVLKCKLVVKILSFDNKNCKEKDKNETCNIPISVRVKENKCGYSRGQSFDLKSVAIKSKLANKLKMGYRKTLKIEELERCQISITQGFNPSHECKKEMQYTIE